MTEVLEGSDTETVEEPQEKDWQELLRVFASSIALFAHEKSDLDLAGYVEMITLSLGILEPGQTFLHPTEQKRLKRRIENHAHNQQIAIARAERLAARKERKAAKGGK